MKWTTLALLGLPGGFVIAACWWLVTRRHDASVMSSAWLQERLRETRVSYDGPRIAFPVKKILNESPLWNRAQQEKEQRQA